MQNFVGLSVHDGYITCGSENNEVSIIYNAVTLIVILSIGCSVELKTYLSSC